ncbi:MAG: molybdopterin-dependent oxidoreductase [Akkermansia sp.]
MSEDTQTLPKDIAAAQGKVNVQINGTWYQIPRGTRIIDACESVGIFVPRFCYHPKLVIAGTCRMCLVEQGMPPRPAPGQAPKYGNDGYQAIQWMPRPIISCANTVCENMGIRTNSDLANEVRRGVLEFYLTNHPLDCPICDQAGECKLQEFSSDYGQTFSRFTETKTKKGKNLSVGPRINLDQERCVLCGRCVRFMRDIVGDEVLSMSQRGTHNAVTIFPGRELDSNYSMNVVDLCPVGALTSKDFRFQMRVWFLKETKTIDVNCGTGTNISIWTRESKAFRITPRQNDEVNSCWMPDSHRLNYKFINSDQRLPQPVVRTDINAPHRASTWEPCIAGVAAALKRVEPNQIAVIASGRMTNEELFLTGKLVKLIGTDKLDIVSRMGEGDNMLIATDANPNTNGARQILGLQNPGASIANILTGVRNGSIKSLVVLGEDLMSDAGFTEDDLKKLDYLVTMNHTANPMARQADAVLPGVTFAEKFGTMINITGRLQRLNRAIMPLGDAHDDWQILRDLCIALGGDKEGLASIISTQDILSLIVRDIPAFAEITWGNIGDQGKQLIDTGVTIPLIEREKARKAN